MNIWRRRTESESEATTLVAIEPIEMRFSRYSRDSESGSDPMVLKSRSEKLSRLRPDAGPLGQSGSPEVGLCLGIWHDGRRIETTPFKRRIPVAKSFPPTDRQTQYSTATVASRGEQQ
jgi:hypothetical protein